MRAQVTPQAIEAVRSRTERNTADDEPLDYYRAARELHESMDDAQQIDEILTERVMRARGAL